MNPELEPYLAEYTKGSLDDEMIKGAREIIEHVETLGVADKIKFAVNLHTTNVYGIVCPEFTKFVADNFDAITQGIARIGICMLRKEIEDDFFAIYEVADTYLRLMHDRFIRQQSLLLQYSVDRNEEPKLNMLAMNTNAMNQLAALVAVYMKKEHDIELIRTNENGDPIDKDGNVIAQRNIGPYDPNKDLMKQGQSS